MYHYTLATNDDLDIIINMINNGRKHIRTYNINQWVNGYPSRDLIKEDIDSKRGYVLKDDNNIIGYFVIMDHDDCYDYIDGKWLNDSPYVAIHRVCTCSFNKGIGSILFNELKKKYNHIRVDTHSGNISMNKCLLKNGFMYCGIIYLKDNSKRNAYEFIK